MFDKKFGRVRNQFQQASSNAMKGQQEAFKKAQDFFETARRRSLAGLSQANKQPAQPMQQPTIRMRNDLYQPKQAQQPAEPMQQPNKQEIQPVEQQSPTEQQLLIEQQPAPNQNNALGIGAPSQFTRGLMSGFRNLGFGQAQQPAQPMQQPEQSPNELLGNNRFARIRQLLGGLKK